MKHIFLVLTAMMCIFSCSKGKVASKKLNDLESEHLKGNIKSIRTITYIAKDIFGDIIKREIKSNNLIIYNRDGNVIENNTYNEIGTLTKKYIHIWNGSIPIETYYYTNTGLNTKYIYTTDENGYIQEQNNYNKEGEFYNKILFKYNKKGYLIESKRYDENGTLYSKHIIERDKNNRTTKIITDAYSGNAKSDVYISYKYNEKGDLLSENTRYSFSSGNDNITYDKYEHDSNGNWIKRIKYTNGELSDIEERTIEYYGFSEQSVEASSNLPVVTDLYKERDYYETDSASISVEELDSID